MTKLSRKQLLAVIGECQSLFGRLEHAYLNDRQSDRAKAVMKLTTQGFRLCVDALRHEPPQVERRPPQTNHTETT